MTWGRFLSLDGLDGTGKSTQCHLLAEWLRGLGQTVVECVDPGGTDLGRALRALLLDHHRAIALPCEALLFMASRAQLVAEVVRPALAAGQTVVSDRFLLANVVYQGHAGGLNPDLLWSIGRLATDGVEPDLTLLLDMPAEAAAQRRDRPADRVEGRGQAFHDRVRLGYLAEAAREPERIHVIDADQRIDLVQADIRQRVAPLFGLPTAGEGRPWPGAG